MAIRAEGEYFNVHTNQDATGNQPTQNGKLVVNIDMLEAMMKIAKLQEDQQQEIAVEIGLGFWVQTGKESGRKYLRGRPSVYFKGDSEDNASVAQKETTDDIPF
jgi:hypothetical protein